MSSSSIKVAVRCRPLLGQERPTGGLDIQNRRILLDSKTYDPDYTFSPTASQEDVFHACRPILQCVKEGMNGTIMVYGQTGTGKTYTMLGNEEAEQGLVHKVVAEMLDYVQQKTMDGAQCALTLSMIEIYNERLTDMLSPNGEEEVTLISGFPRFTHKATLCRVSDAIETIQRGLAWRHTAATLMNERSSRSHVVFIFDLEEYNSFTDQTDVAHLFMIDLAGSESLKKSQASGVAAGEAGKINKSLLALKSVFLALSNTNEATRPSHVPYRDSKLTELLQDSIGGTARTLMIACISSVGRDIEETKSTLLYAVKARSIRNAANTEKEKLLVRLRSMEVENQKLRNRLQERVNERGGYYITKEEHEQTQEMEESYGKMKEAVEQLMQDRQNSDARQHIWESQVKVLRTLLDDKATELQNFKEIYYEALRRFENQAATLQRMVRGGVGAAKDAVQLSFADNYARLHAWRTELLNALEEPLPTSMPVVPDEQRHEENKLPQPQQESTVNITTTSERCATPPPLASAQSSIQAALAGASAASRKMHSITPPVSPVRNENGSPSGTINNNSSTAHTGTYAVPSSSAPSLSASTTAPGAVAGRAAGSSRSARGSTASSSLQRVSSITSATVSPTRRGGRSRLGGAAPTSASTSRRATQTSPSLAACHPPLFLPMAPPATLPPSGAAAVAAKDPHVNQEEEEEEEDHTGQVVEAQDPLHPSAGGATAPLHVSPTRLLPSSSSSSPQPAPTQPSWSVLLAQHDAQCMRTVHRLNNAVLAMLEECLRAFEDYRSRAEHTEDTRRQGLEDVCRRLRSDFEAHLTQLQRIDAASQRDLRDARRSFSDQLQLARQLRPTAETAPFQQALRCACTEVVRHATHAFPHPSTPAAAEAAMDAVVVSVQRCSAAFSVQALDPLASSSVALNASVGNAVATSSSSSPSSPLPLRKAATTGSMSGPVTQELAVAPMPRLSPPLYAEAIASSRGQEAVREDEEGAVAEEEQEEEEHVSALSSSPVRETRFTTVSRTFSQQQQQQQQPLASARASSLRSSAALSTVPVNRVTSRAMDSRRGGLGSQVERCKRTRSNASSPRGEGASRRTTTMHRALR